MTQDEIIEMARQVDDLSAAKVDWDYEWVVYFAKLVDVKATTKEREACALLCDDIDLPFIASAIRERGET